MDVFLKVLIKLKQEWANSKTNFSINLFNYLFEDIFFRLARPSISTTVENEEDNSEATVKNGNKSVESTRCGPLINLNKQDELRNDFRACFSQSERWKVFVFPRFLSVESAEFAEQHSKRSVSVAAQLETENSFF